MIVDGLLWCGGGMLLFLFFWLLDEDGR